MAQPTAPLHAQLTTLKGAQVALQGVEITVDVHATSSRVRVRQRYINREETPIEASYLFPLEDEAAVVGFRIETDGRVLEGEVQEREEAFGTYDDAQLDGHGAYLLDQERPNAFTARVGNLKPGQEATVELSYVSTLRVEGGRARLLIPTVVAPRYVPAGAAAQDGMSEEERWGAPRAAEVPYGLSLRVRVSAPEGVSGLESPSHAVRLSLTPAGAEASLSSERAALDRDFVLLFDALPAHAAGEAVVARGPRGEALLACTFTPRAPEGAAAAPLDVTFVLDCSGSMDGAPIEEAKRALGLLWRTLAEGDRFNLCCFGSTHKLMWPAPRSFSQETLTAALAYLKAVDANLGGTELLAPMRALLETQASQERAGTLLLITDGQLSNESEVVALCERHRAHARVFTFGVGAGVSETLVREMARVSGGAAELIFKGERVEPKVLRAAKQLRQPSVQLKDAKVGRRALRFADGAPRLFYGESVTFYAELPNAPDDLAAVGDSVVLRAEQGEWRLPLSAAPAGAERPVAALWARAALRPLERAVGAQGKAGEGAREQVRALALAYGLMSSQTSFVAVETRAEGERAEGAPAPRVVPLMRLSDHAGASRDAGHARASAPAAMFSLYSPPVAAFKQHRPAPRSAKSDPSIFHYFVSGISTGVVNKSDSEGADWLLYSKRPESAEEQLFTLLALQRADGRFEWDELLGRLLRGAQPSAAERADELRVTALVLALLRGRFAALADLWELPGRKATAALDAGAGAAAESLRLWAEGVVGAP